MFDRITHLLFIIVGILLALVLLIICSILLFNFSIDLSISTHGLFAMFLGCFCSLFLVGFLMVLVFISHRQGFDDEVIEFDFDKNSLK